MNWREHNGYGGSFSETVLNIVCEANAESERGVVEIQCAPYKWERLCAELGSSRPVSLRTSEDRASFSTAVAGRVVEVYAVKLDVDFRWRVRA